MDNNANIWKPEVVTVGHTDGSGLTMGHADGSGCTDELDILCPP